MVTVESLNPRKVVTHDISLLQSPSDEKNKTIGKSDFQVLRESKNLEKFVPCRKNVVEVPLERPPVG